MINLLIALGVIGVFLILFPLVLLAGFFFYLGLLWVGAWFIGYEFTEQTWMYAKMIAAGCLLANFVLGGGVTIKHKSKKG